VKNVLPINFLQLLVQYILLYQLAIDMERKNLVLEIWFLKPN